MARKEWRKQQVFPTITLAGVAVNRDLVQHIAAHVDEPTASKLERALANETRILALEIEDRELILRALEDCPDGLTELRATVLQEHVGRKRDGLGWRPPSHSRG